MLLVESSPVHAWPNLEQWASYLVVLRHTLHLEYRLHEKMEGEEEEEIFKRA